ncbi:LysE/ArgO family amino acid transporter [Haliangium sp.]
MGLTVGVLSGVPIGPVNLAVIDAAYRYSLRRAITVGLGGAVGDGIFAILGILGMGPILKAYPVVKPALYAISGVVLFVYALIAIRNQTVVAVDTPRPGKAATAENATSPWSGFLLGVALILMNPAALVTWVIIVGLFMEGATTGEGLSATVGVMLGSSAWFTGVAYLADHGKKVIGEKTLKITRFVAVLILGYSIFAIGRAIAYWFF